MPSFKDYSAEERREMAKKGMAMPDGSFPIATKEDLRNAIQATGRASNSAAAKRHIIKRARAMGMTDMLPEGWNVTAATPDRLGELYQVGFAEPPAAGADGGVSDWFPALHAGDHIYAGREIKIAESDLDKAVENFERYWKPRGGVPVDYDHSFVETGDSTAAGWIVAMKREGDTLYEQVEWTPKAAQQIADGEYRFYSAEFTSEWINERGVDEGFTVLAGALTNRPFLRGLAPVALSQKVVAAVGEWTLAHAAKLVPGDASAQDETRREVPKPNTDTEQTFTVEIDGEDQEVQSFKVEIDGETKELSVDDVTAMAQAKADADKAEADKAEAERKASAAKGETEALSQKVEGLRKDLDLERFNAAFATAQRQGRVDAKPSTREKWEGRLEQFGLEATKDLLEDLPADTVPVVERGLEGGGSAPGETPVAADVPEDTDPEMYTLDQRAQQILTEKPDLEGGYRAALTQARKEAKAAAGSAS